MLDKLLPRLRWAGLAAGVLASSAFAHEGHGPQGSHWHATDLVGLAIALAVGLWLWNRLRK